MGEPGKAESKLESDPQHRCGEPCGDLADASPRRGSHGHTVRNGAALK